MIIQELNNIKSVDFVFLTGGLGPTSDDVTLEALYSFFDKKKPKLINNTIGTASGLWYQKKKNKLCCFSRGSFRNAVNGIKFSSSFFP